MEREIFLRTGLDTQARQTARRANQALKEVTEVIGAIRDDSKSVR
jgi:hypothetical protein